ncbi:hypothetical protein C6P61_08155 [Malikia spinosa]|uniref:Uncharacterized protein n=1 Tax=Malikia spinosa TaxID=86180 RepID=A0A2S9KF63_9BURK|nr:hypothetical protein C6P61_08155 [Malikia spinosa]
MHLARCFRENILDKITEHLSRTLFSDAVNHDDGLTLAPFGTMQRLHQTIDPIDHRLPRLHGEIALDLTLQTALCDSYQAVVSRTGRAPV